MEDLSWISCIFVVFWKPKLRETSENCKRKGKKKKFRTILHYITLWIIFPTELQSIKLYWTFSKYSVSKYLANLKRRSEGKASDHILTFPTMAWLQSITTGEWSEWHCDAMHWSQDQHINFGATKSACTWKEENLLVHSGLEKHRTQGEFTLNIWNFWRCGGWW